MLLLTWESCHHSNATVNLSCCLYKAHSESESECEWGRVKSSVAWTWSKKVNRSKVRRSDCMDLGLSHSLWGSKGSTGYIRKPSMHHCTIGTKVKSTLF